MTDDRPTDRPTDRQTDRQHRDFLFESDVLHHNNRTPLLVKVDSKDKYFTKLNVITAFN